MRLLFAAFLGLFLAACTRPPEAGKELLFSVFGSLDQAKEEQKIVAAFEAENPDIKIKLMIIGQRIANYEQKIQVMMVGNAAPDLIMLDVGSYDDWASRGVLIDVTDIVKELDAENGGLLPVPKRTFEREGKYFCAPVNVQGITMYCNLEALRKAGIAFSSHGWTWREITEMAPGLSARHGEASAPTEYALVFPPPEMMFASFGVRLFDDPENPTRVTADSPQTRQALEVYREFSRKGYAVPPDVGSDQGTYQLFRDGRVAFFFSGRALTPELAGYTHFPWDIAPVPKGAPDGASFNHGTGLAIWKGTRYPEDARKFLKFYAGIKGMRIAMQGGRCVPVFRKEAFSTDFLGQRPPPSIKCFVDTMEAGASVIPLYGPGYAEVTDICNRCVQSVLFRDISIESATEEMQQNLQTLLDRRNKNAHPYHR